MISKKSQSNKEIYDYFEIYSEKSEQNLLGAYLRRSFYLMEKKLHYIHFPKQSSNHCSSYQFNPIVFQKKVKL